MNIEDKLLEEILYVVKEIKDEVREKPNRHNNCKKLMQIPGKSILENHRITFKLGEVDRIPQIKINHKNSDSLLPTVVKAYFNKDVENPNDQSLSVFGVAFINEKFGRLRERDFEVFYNFGLDFSGDYQMNIYITFTHTEELASEYNYYPFEVNFNEGAVCCAAGNPVPLEKITMVRTYLINRDPETSRGTVTSVQSGDN